MSIIVHGEGASVVVDYVLVAGAVVAEMVRKRLAGSYGGNTTAPSQANIGDNDPTRLVRRFSYQSDATRTITDLPASICASNCSANEVVIVPS